MRVVYEGSVAGNRTHNGQMSREPRPVEQIQQKQSERSDRIVRPISRINGERIHFADLARFAWPKKTEFHLAHLVRVDPRTCRRWLAGDNEPPAEALGVILAEIMKRFHQRD
jgi:hypothetical protein